MAIAYSKIIVEVREISLKNRPEELYNISLKGTVPVLYEKDGVVIDESLEIMIWALSIFDSDLWFKKEKKIQLELINENDNEFKNWLDKYKYFDRYPEKNQKYYRTKCNKFLNKLNSRLENHDFIISNNISMVDIAVFPFIRQFTHVNPIYIEKEYIKIYLWLQKILNSNLFISIMKKYDEYVPGQLPIITNFNN